MMNLPELGSVEEVVAKIFDWITETTQYKGTVRSGPRTAAIKDADLVDDVSPSAGTGSVPAFDDYYYDNGDEEDCDDLTVNAMSKGNSGYTGSRSNARPKPRSKGGQAPLLKVVPPPPGTPKCPTCGGYHTDLRTCPCNIAKQDKHFTLGGEARCGFKCHGKWTCNGRSHFGRHHRQQ